MRGFLFPLGGPQSGVATLGFAIGPDPNAPGQEHNPPYTGPGTYTHILLSASSADVSHSIAGSATVVINADKQTGTFQMDDGSGAGSFDCGSPIADS